MSNKETPDVRSSGRFIFLLTPGYYAMTFSMAMETLNVANRMAGRTLFETIVCAEGGVPVTDSLGAKFPIDHGLEPVSRDDTMILVCGDAVREACTPAILQWIRKAARMGCEIGGLSTGVWLMAEAGLMDGLPATLHWEHRTSFAEEHPEVEMSEYTYVCQNKRYSTAGGTSVIDLMLQLISEKATPELSALVADQLMYTPAPELT